MSWSPSHNAAMMPLIYLMVLVAVAGGVTVPPPSIVCLDEATYNPTTGKCECNGGLKGDGDLCCYDDSAYRLCELRGDPLLYSANNMDAVMDIPCAQSMYLTEVQEGANHCHVQIYANTKYVAAGNIYPDRISVSIAVNEGRQHYIHVLGQNFWHPIKNSLVRQEEVNQASNRIIDIDGVTFVMDFDENQSMWTVSGCGTIVKFRKYKGSRFNQPLTPGLCIQTSLSNPYRSVDDGNLCGLKKKYDEAPYGELAHKLLANVLDQQLDLEGQEDIGTKENKAQCVAAATSFNLCPGPLKRRQAIERCAGFVLHPTIRLCLVAAGLNQADIMEWFAICLKASCGQDAASCYKMGDNEIILKCNRRVVVKCPRW